MESSLEYLQSQSGTLRFASVFGKSTIPQSCEEYAIIGQIAELLLEKGYGIIHGGYDGGAMSAISDIANAYIDKHQLSPFLNIAVPQVEHDALWKRVDSASFTSVAPNIFERLKMVVSGDIAVVCPLGGEGTELEATVVFHENIVRQGMNTYGGHNLKMTPLIFFQSPHGTQWKELLQQKLLILDGMTKQTSQLEWLHFVSSIHQLADLLEEMDKNH